MLKSLKYQYYTVLGTRRTRIVTWDDHYGNDVRSSYKFGYATDTGVLRGLKAYDKLTQPLNDEGQTFIDMIPTFIRPVELVSNPDYVYGMGEKAKTMPNPNYQTELDAFNWNVSVMHFLLRDFLTLVCKVTFPAIPDTGSQMKWWEESGDEWIPVPVEVGKYPGGSRWVTVEDEDKDRWVNTFTDYALALNNDKDAILKRLLMI